MRAKLGGLLVVASLVPILIAAFLDIRSTRQVSLNAAAALLDARDDQLADEVDDFNRAFTWSSFRLAHLPDIQAFVKGGSVDGATAEIRARETLQVWPASDPRVRGAAILDRTGMVRLATERSIEGQDLSRYAYVRRALEGGPVVSDVHVAVIDSVEIPSLGYLTPIRQGAGPLLGMIAIWVRASALWEVVRSSNELAGPGSFAVLLDEDGVRIAHTYNDDIVFHPAGPLDEAVVEELSRELRFGLQTRALLSDVRPFPAQFERARAANLNRSLFLGIAPVNQKWNYGVGRRLHTVPWSLFYMVPEASVEGPIVGRSRAKGAISLGLLAFALVVGAAFAGTIVRPMLALSEATRALARGDLSARVEVRGSDEIGRLGMAFNAMAARIEDQDRDLRHGRDHLEEQVKARSAALRASEARFRGLIESGILGVITADTQGNVLDANDAFLSMVGYSLQEVLSGTVRWADMTPPEWAYLDDRAVAQLEDSGIAPPWEKEYIRKDGSRVPVMVGVAMVQPSSGECVAFILDITERKRAEDALVRSDRRFKRLAQSGIVGIVIGDSSGNMREVNDAFLGIVGYTRADFEAGLLSGKSLNTPDSGPAQQAARLELMAHGSTRPWEKEFLRKDGSRVPVLAAVTSLDPPDTLTVVVDLTERKRSEAAVRSLEQQAERDAQFRALLESAPDAMVIVDPGGAIVLVNAQAERLFGYAREELLGRSVDLLVPDRLRAMHPQHRAHYVESPKFRAMGSGLDLRARRKDGSEFPVEISLSPIQTRGDVLISSAIRDTSERKAAEQQLRRAKERAERASRELEAFSYSVAHDLRTPLRAINGFSVALIEDVGPRLQAEERRYLERIGDAATRMAHLIDALLALARVSRADVRREWVDLSEVAEGVLRRLRQSEPARCVEFVAEPHLVVRADPQLVRSLLENLLGNAWKFAAKKERTRIELGRSAGKTTAPIFFVRDNGAGFDMAFAGKLFTQFQRLHAPGEFPGTGIGLATVHRIVVRHGGRVWADGVPDQGATFSFTLEGAEGDSVDYG